MCACVLNARLKSRIVTGSASAGAGRGPRLTLRRTKWWKQLGHTRGFGGLDHLGEEMGDAFRPRIGFR